MDCRDRPEVKIYQYKWGIREERPTWSAEQSRAAADESSSRLGDEGIHQREAQARVLMLRTNTDHAEKQALQHK